MLKKIGSHNMTRLYLNLCYNMRKSRQGGGGGGGDDRGSRPPEKSQSYRISEQYWS